MVDRFDYFTNVVELLPNQRYSVNGSDPAAVTDIVASGTVIDVIQGAGYAPSSSSDATSVVLAFDDPAAAWKVIEVTLDVEEGVSESGHVDDGPTVRFGLVLDGDADAETAIRGLRGQHLFTPLSRRGHFKHDATLLNLPDEGLLGTVDGSGIIEFPALGEAEAERFMGRTDSVGDVVTAGRTDRDVIRYDGVLRQ